MRDDKSTKEINYMKDRLKIFEGSSASGFKGFNGVQIPGQTIMNSTQIN